MYPKNTNEIQFIHRLIIHLRENKQGSTEKKNQKKTTNEDTYSVPQIIDKARIEQDDRIFSVFLIITNGHKEEKKTICVYT